MLDIRVMPGNEAFPVKVYRLCRACREDLKRDV